MAVETGLGSGDGVFDTPPPPVPFADPRGLPGQECEAGLVACQARLVHDEWLRACWMLETARARADTLERWPESDPRVIAAALGWSVTMAASRLETAQGALERLPRLGDAMREGRLEQAKVSAFVSGLRDVTDAQASTVVDALIGQAPKLGLWELQQRVAAAVVDVDPLGAENRRNAAVARSRVSTRTAPSGAVEIHGLDLDHEMAVPAFERIVAIAEGALEQLKAAGIAIGAGKVQAQVYLRLLHGCPTGTDDLAVLEQVVRDLTPPPAPPDSDDDGPDRPDEGGPDDGPDSGGLGGPDGSDAPPDLDDLPDDGADDSGSVGDPDQGDARGDCGASDSGASDSGASDSGASDSGASDSGAGVSASSGRRDELSAGVEPPPAGRGSTYGSTDDPDATDGALSAAESASGWQPGDPEPDPPPPDTPDPRVPSTEPPPSLAARWTPRGLVFLPATTRTTLACALGLTRAHGRLRVGTVTGWDAHRAVWARTTAQFRVLAYDQHGHLEHVLLVRPPQLPGADPRYRRQVVELTAFTTEIDTLDEQPLIGIWAELAHRTQRALAAARERPPDEHPARTTRDATQRFPGAELTRWIHARDRTCRFPMCTVPAVACALDHTHDHTMGGPTRADNLGALSVGDHLRKHAPESGWTVRQTTPGTFVWTAPTGTHHTVTPEPYRPLRPVPREPFDHGITDTRGEPRPQRPWRPRTNKHGHLTDAQHQTLHDIDRRRRHEEQQPPNPYDDEPPF